MRELCQAVNAGLMIETRHDCEIFLKKKLKLSNFDYILAVDIA